MHAEYGEYSLVMIESA